MLSTQIRMHDEGMLYLLFRVSKWVSKYFWGAGLKIGLCGSFMKTDHWIWNKISPMERSHDLTHSWTRGSMSYIHFARYSLLRRYSPVLHSFARYSLLRRYSPVLHSLSSPTFFRYILSIRSQAYIFSHAVTLTTTLTYYLANTLTLIRKKCSVASQLKRNFGQYVPEWWRTACSGWMVLRLEKKTNLSSDHRPTALVEICPPSLMLT